jgi:dinuclear metal center YbgI/SA1388 family protein
MKLKEIIKELDKLVPIEGYEHYPKYLITGTKDQEIKKVAVTLNFLSSTLDEAKKRGCNLLLLHHGPPNYDPFESEATKKKINHAKKLGIAVYTLPLCLDASELGSNRGFTKILGFEVEQVDLDFEGKPLLNAVTKLKGSIRHKELIEKLKNYPSVYIKIFGKRKKQYNRVIFAAGGGFKWDLMEQTNPDVYISGDLNIRAVRLAHELGFLVIELSHHSMENYPMKFLTEALQKRIDVPVEFIEEPEFDVQILKGKLVEN